MDKIYDQNNNLIADAKNIIPDKTSTKIVTKLLNGKSLIQIIGEPQPVLHVICYVSYTNKMILDDIKASGKLIKALHNGETDSGYIEGEINWELFVERQGDQKIFVGTFDIAVNE
ncbi:MAG: hypothetical protein JXQ23_00465 [Clostridia bacterium]|nr:hypothetical protein [Clostridia bacterium]